MRIKSHEPPSLRFSRIRQKGIKPMTENEKKLLQAKHRLEEAEMRDRQKERKARTRRLIQEGAILEKALPQTTQMTLEQLEDFCVKYSNQSDDFYERPAIGRFFFEGRTYSPPAKQAVVSLPLVGLVRSSQASLAAFPEGAGNVASEHSLCSRLYILHYQQNDEVAYCHPIPPPAYENLPPAAFTQLWVSHFQRHPCSLFKREIERKDGENKWQSIIWKQK